MDKKQELSVVVSSTETLLAKELIRQRTLPDGSVENLVKWCIFSPPKNLTLSDDKSSSTSLNDENRPSKYVFLWMSNQELMVCCPQLYNAEPDKGLMKQTNKRSEAADHSDPPSDVEDLDDMRHDVVKLVNRARKQMQRLKNMSKSLPSLTHTIKVLRTYASLGSLSNVFRETGALDLILELLWTKDEETRRAAGRMLRALALNDAGSRAYVLLSLTQNENEGHEQKKHYADFENRVMVMEMFAETASGEEAHAVALDSVQLPQVTGKTLFTLMKCYLRVTSLMDIDSSSNTHQGKTHCSWMTLTEGSMCDETVHRFEVSMAISDLIYELGRIMDWNKSPKAGSPFSDTSNLATSSSAASTKNPPAVKQHQIKEKKTDNNDKEVSGVCKPLFAERLQETTLDPSLLASLIKSDHPLSEYKHPSAFDSRRHYANYVKSIVKAGYRVRACQSYQDVTEGDEGIYRQHNESTPPVQVFWHRLNRAYWVYWHHIVLVRPSDVDADIPVAEPLKFIANPETSLLWPLLSGMSIQPKRIYGLRPPVQEVISKQNPELNWQCPEKDWWLLLFYVSKLSKTAKESVKNIYVKNLPSSAHMSSKAPSRDTVVLIMHLILGEINEWDKKSLAKSAMCKSIMDEIIKEQEDAEKMRQEADKPSSPSKDVQAAEDILGTSSSSQSRPVDGSEEQESPASSATKDVEELVDSRVQDYGSVEEYAKAVEMGLRISLIQDGESEKKYGKLFLDKDNYALGQRLWKMQQEEEKLSTVSKLVEKGNKASRIISLTVLHNLLSRTNNPREEIEEMFGDILPTAEDSDASVVLCYLNLMSAALKEQTGAPRSRELQCLEISLATTGHLKAAFDAIARFPEHRELVSVAIHDICSIMGAREFSANPTANQSYTNIITAIISSIVMTTTGGTEASTSSQSSGTNVLSSFIQAVYQFFTDADKAKKSESSADSQTKLFCSDSTLVDAVSVVCMILRKDQSKALVPKRETMLRIVTTGLQIATNPGPLRRLVMRMKGFVMSLSRDVLDDDTADESGADKYLDFTEDGLTIGRFVVPSSNPDLEENFDDCLNKIKSKEHAEAKEATSKLIINVVLPILRKQSVLSNECMQCVAQVKNFVFELSELAQDLNLLLLESYWSKLVAALHHVIEQCALMADGVKATLQEVAGDCMSTLLTLAEMDKDFAVELCGLEAKQTITRLLDKHGSVAKANDLKQLVTSCERHRSLHNKLLAVVLGGCISTALRCVEEARRSRREINVPLFAQLLDNLCRGADVEMKEHKCWDRLEVSTNQRQVVKLTDGNPKTYWESNGSSGGHWIDVFMKKGVVVRKMTILVAQEDSSYMPARVVVLGGSSSQDATTQLSCVTLSSSDRDVVILENAWRYWPVIRISIRRCQQGGIDTRIHGIDIIGPKPSFWPILRRQLYVRTSLAYSVQAHSWVAQALEGAEEQLSLNRHKILDLSDKIVEALNFEQRFADSYLPNAESALVLGHACRSALSAPILAALLKSTEDSTCLFADLMQSYVSAVRIQEDSRRDRVFASKLRRITRILVDLDTKKQRGGTSGSSGPRSGGKKSGGVTRGARSGSYSLWDKRLHTRHGEAGNVDSSKVSTAQSVTSFRGYLDMNSRNDADHDSSSSSSQNESGEESYEAPSQVPELCKRWAKVVEREFTEFLSKVLGKSPVPSSGDCLELGAAIVTEFRFLQSCTRDLFGANSHFAMAFAAGVCKSFMVLGTDDCLHFSVVCSYVIHRYVALETAHEAIDQAHAEKLRGCVGRVIAMLQVAAGADLCRVLEPIYCSMMCSRVLRCGGDFAMETESRVVSQLHACFPGGRPMSILQDIAYSGNLWQRFLPNWLEAYDVAIRSSTSTDADTLWDDYKLLSNGGFQATMLRPSAWNLKPVAGEKFQRCLSTLDRRLHRFTRDFGLFFRRERTEGQSCCFSSTGPSLHWTTDGSATVADAANNVLLRVTTLQMILLLHFNEVAESKFEDWRDCDALDAADQLLQAGVIEKTDEGAFRAASVIPHDVDCCVSPDDKLLALWNARDEMERHDNRRRAIVDCAIVRIMKKRHECTGDLLLHDVMLYCHAPGKSEYAPEEGANHDPFLPSARMVRTRCEHLTSLGYLIHSDLKPQMLTYNPDTSVQSDDVTIASGAGNGTTAATLDGADAKFSRLESPLKDSILTSESVFVQVDTSVSKNTTSSSPNHATSLHTFTGDSASGKQEVPYLFGFEAAATETLTSAQILAEIRTLFSKVSDLLSVDADTSEALVLQFEWNDDKLIESFVVDQAKTLARIGVAQVKNNSYSDESIEDECSCPVCFNDLTADDTLVPLCGHRCCRSCWQTYLRMQVEQDTSANTTCPVSDCSARAVTSLIKRAFDEDLADIMAKHETSLVRSYVQSNRALSWCHNPKGCSRLLRKSAESHESGLCAYCGWQTCFLCAYSEAHFPASCSHMSQWVDDGGYYEGMNDDAQSKHLARLIAKRCPNCLANIEKNDGCLHMKCTKCSWDFCWRCLQPWRPSHRDYYNCSRKVSKLAQSGLKFVEYSKRCQYHNQVKQFAYSIRARILAIDDQSVPPANVRFATDACTKMAQCRKALAYCNVFSYYSEDSERMGAIALHSAALENHTLALQALISDMMLSAADIKCAVAAFRDCDVTKVRREMSDCDAAMERIAVFARQDMKVGSPRKAGECSATEQSMKIFRSRSLSALDREADVSNARPGGMSDDDDDNDDVRFYSDSDSDNVMSLHTTSDEDDDDDDGEEGDDDPNMLFVDSDDQPTDSSEFGFDSDTGCLF